MARSRHCRWSLLQIAAAVLVVAAGAALALVLPGSANAQPEATIVLSPASGPCDAAVQVKGTGFEAPSGPLDHPELYLLQPGTADVNMDYLSYGPVGRHGTFSQWVGMREYGCQAAALDSQAEQPTGYLFIAASSSRPIVPPGEPIPDIIAVAQYAYTTTTPHVPTETLTISPASGPCDGTVEVTGSGFEPGIEVLLKLGRPGSDASLGTLATPVADADGQFSVRFSFAELGCQAAQMNMIYGDPTRPQIGIGAYRAVRPTPVPPGIPPALAGVAYTYTTTEVAGGAPAQALPATGSGPGPSSGPPGWLGLVGALGGLGVTLVIASLYLRRKRT